MDKSIRWPALLRMSSEYANDFQKWAPTICRRFCFLRNLLPSVGACLNDLSCSIRCSLFISVRRLILNYMNTYHHSEVLDRKARRLVRKQFWTTGVNDVWCMDQHDKWRRFQLFLHLCLEPYSGRIIWLKIWWTNRNPRLICGFYCDAVAENEGMSVPRTLFCIHLPHRQFYFLCRHANFLPK